MVVQHLPGRRRVLATLLLALAMVLTLVTPAATAAPAGGSSQAVTAQNPTPGMGMVVTNHPIASRVGAEILAKGGNAVDAAAAIAFALNVVQPQYSGIAATAYIMVRPADTGEVTVIETGEMAPAAATPDMFLGPDGKPIPTFDRQTHGNAVGVPGMLKGLSLALEKFGTMSVANLIQPAIQLADEGAPANWTLAGDIPSGADRLKKGGAGADVFLPDGKPLKEGDIVVQKDLANTFRIIAEQGADAMYKGEVGQAMVSAVQDKGGRMTVEDLAAYEAKIRPAVTTTYRGYDVVSMPPPSSGGLVVAQMLKLLEPYDLKAMGHNTPDTLNVMIEAMQLAYADRAKYVGDPDKVKLPLQGLLNPDYLAQRGTLIDTGKANPDIKAGDAWAFEPGGKPADALSTEVQALDEESVHTTHFSVVDQWGNAVAWTTTLQAGWGSGIMVPGYGFMLNNMMTNFDAVPGGANQVESRKRPLTNMTPTMLIKDGKPFMVLGSPGGAQIMTHVLQTILNVVDHGMDISDAVNAARINSSGYPEVSLEAGIPLAVAKELEARGHKPVYGTRQGSVQAVVFDPDTGKLHGGGDARRDGTAIAVPATQ